MSLWRKEPYSLHAKEVKMEIYSLVRRRIKNPEDYVKAICLRHLHIDISDNLADEILAETFAEIQTGSFSYDFEKEVNNFWFMMNTSKYMDIRNGFSYTADSLNNYLLTQCEPVKGKDGKVVTNLVKYAQVSGFLHCARETIYQPYPDQMCHKVIRRSNDTYLNLFTGLDPMEKQEPSEYTKSLFDIWFNYLIGNNPEHKKIVMQFIKHTIMNPHQKIRWSPMIIGNQGTGKNTLHNMIEKILGRENVTITDADTILKFNFNGWIKPRLWCTVNELEAVGENRSCIYETLKMPISDEFINLHEKFKETETLKNTTNYMLFSNRDDCMRLPPNDRRIYVVNNLHKETLRERRIKGEFFDELYKVLRPEEFKWYVCNIDLKDFNPNILPVSEDKLTLINKGKDELETTIASLAQSNIVGINEDYIVMTVLKLALADHNLDKRLGYALKNLNYECVGVKRIMGKPHRVWQHRDGMLPDEFDFNPNELKYI